MPFRQSQKCAVPGNSPTDCDKYELYPVRTAVTLRMDWLPPAQCRNRCRSFVGHKTCKNEFTFSNVNQLSFEMHRVIGTNRASSECNTSGSCRYDNEVKSFCPIRMVGLRSNGKSFSCLTSITFAMPLSVQICICLSPSVTSTAIVAPSQTFPACGIHIRAPCHPIQSNRKKKIRVHQTNWANENQMKTSTHRIEFAPQSRPRMNKKLHVVLFFSLHFSSHASHIQWQWVIVSHFKCLFVIPPLCVVSVWIDRYMEQWLWVEQVARRGEKRRERGKDTHSP